MLWVILLQISALSDQKMNRSGVAVFTPGREMRLGTNDAPVSVLAHFFTDVTGNPANRLLSVCIWIPHSSITAQSELRLWGVQKRCSESLHGNLEQWKSNYVKKQSTETNLPDKLFFCGLRQPVFQTKSVATGHHMTSILDLNYGLASRLFFWTARPIIVDIGMWQPICRRNNWLPIAATDLPN